MSKKTANNAIDFSRLFAMKDQLARNERHVEDRDSGVIAVGTPMIEARIAATNEPISPKPFSRTVHRPSNQRCSPRRD